MTTLEKFTALMQSDVCESLTTMIDALYDAENAQVRKDVPTIDLAEARVH
jgi:hypothetical protein